MRVGEFIVVSPRNGTNEIFIKSICREVERINDTINFGQLEIGSQLFLHFYGIHIEENDHKGGHGTNDNRVNERLQQSDNSFRGRKFCLYG